MNKSISIKNIIVAITAILGIIATFLPWLSASAFGIVVTAKGSDGDGWISFAFFVIVLVLAVIGIFQKASWIKIVITIAAAIAFIVAGLKIPDALNNGLTIGVGIYLAIIAGIAGAVVPWLPIDKQINV